MAKKKKIIKKTPTRVHSFRCTDKDWKELKKLAKECGMSIGKYLVETGKKHHPRQRLTPEESKAENIAQMVPPYRSVGTARSGSVVPLISV